MASPQTGRRRSRADLSTFARCRRSARYPRAAKWLVTVAQAEEEQVARELARTLWRFAEVIAGNRVLRELAEDADTARPRPPDTRRASGKRSPWSPFGSPEFQIGELSARTGVSPMRLYALYQFAPDSYPRLVLNPMVVNTYAAAQVRRDICVLVLMARQLVTVESGPPRPLSLHLLRGECDRLGFPDAEYNLLRDLSEIDGVALTGGPHAEASLRLQRRREPFGHLTGPARSSCAQAAERMAPLGAASGRHQPGLSGDPARPVTNAHDDP